MKRIIAEIGIENSYDNKSRYRWNSPYSHTLISQLCYEVYKQYLINVGKTKKCIVLDCDNVLWGGIVSEDGVNGVILGSNGLGKVYQDFQRYLLYLYYTGVILTVCSKNEKSDILKIFRDHSEMVLKEEHIACFQVNWNSKVDNIQEIAYTLNIGLDSMVFIDDSDFEIQSVKSILPDVTTIKYTHDNTFLNQFSCFCLTNKIDIKKVKQRILSYKTNKYRKSLRNSYDSFDEYIQSLEMVIDIHETLPIEINRIAELTQRANKYTNGRRYTFTQLSKILHEDDYHLYTIMLSDKFSNLGLVGAIGIKKATLDLFLLSCRALGGGIEERMVLEINKHHIKNYFFASTGKNEEIYILLKSNF